jgi:small multidrug resistance pump
VDTYLVKISWFILIIAIVLEVSGTISMKLSEGFTKVGPVIAMFIFYAMGLSLLALALKRIDISVAYAVWSGLGTALITLIGVLWFREPTSVIKIISVAFIIIGVIGLNLENGH